MATGATFNKLKDRETGATVIADDDDNEFSNILDNLDPTGLGSGIATTAEHNATSDPYLNSANQIPSDLETFLQQFAYQIKLLSGKSNWVNDCAAFGSKGADVASANALVLGKDGNQFDITGTTTIQSIGTLEVGAVVTLQFDAILTLTHHATDLILPGAANITTAAGDIAEFVEYASGDWRCSNYSRASGVSVITQDIRDTSRGLIVKTNTGDTDHDVDIDADEIILQNAAGESYRASSVNLTMVGDATVGINALDAGTLANSTWYYLWVIYDGTTVASLGSTSSTAPTMPSGYTYKALVGAVITDGSANFLGFYQADTYVEYNVIQAIKNGSFTTGAWTSQSITSFFPPTAKRIKIAFNTPGNQLGLSPRSDGHAGEYFNFGGGVATDFGIFASSNAMAMTLEIRYVATIYYYVNNAGGALAAVGWEY